MVDSKVDSNAGEGVRGWGQLITTAAAAALIGVSREYVRRLCRQRRIASNKYDSMWLLSLEAVNDYISRRYK